MRLKIFITVIFVIVAILFVDCKEDSLWKGQIKTEDGITIVENPKTPMYKEPVLTLSEDICIGADENRPDYLFYRINSIAVDQEGNIFVTDEGEKHIQVYNAEGEYLRTIGQVGEGPGELGRPTEIFIAGNDEIVITDPKKRQLHFFSVDGNYLGSKKFKDVYPLQIARDSHENYYTMNFVRAPGSKAGYFELLKLNSDLEIVSSLVKAEISSEAKKNEFDQIPEFAVRDDANLILGYPASYTFNILDPDGKVTRIIRKKYDLIEIPDEVRKKAKEENHLAYELPKYMRPFRDFFLDDTGRLFVLTPGENVAEMIYNCEVFNPEGRFLGSFPIKLSIIVKITVIQDKLYMVDEDSEGNPCVRRYQITWNI